MLLVNYIVSILRDILILCVVVSIKLCILKLNIARLVCKSVTRSGSGSKRILNCTAPAILYTGRSVICGIGYSLT